MYQRQTAQESVDTKSTNELGTCEGGVGSLVSGSR